MSSILFLLGVAAFLVVIHWTYVNDTPDADAGQRGLLAMTAPRADATPSEAQAARWKRPGAPGAGRAQPKAIRPKGDPPRWRRERLRRR